MVDPAHGATVEDVNRAFREKKIRIELPYPADWEVKDLQILEKKDSARTVKVLLAVELIREGRIIRDLCYLEGDVDRSDPGPREEPKGAEKSRNVLAVRNRLDFDGEAEVLNYLKEAFASLLREYDYKVEEHPEADCYGTLGSRGFFAMFCCRCDALATEKGRHLIGLRKKYRHLHDYGLVMPAFQEPLGVPLSEQETWVMTHVDRLSTHRVGVYGVDNSDPNRIYPFTIYPQVRGLLRYFVATSRQWQDVRAQYVLSRKR
jgi:hypothetical protein